MATIGPISITLPDTAPMQASFASVFEHLAASRGAAEEVARRFPAAFVHCGGDTFELADDAGDLLFAQMVDGPAFRAGKIDALKFDPSDRYLEAVAAIAALDGQVNVAFDHGWPILSVGDGSTTVTEAGGAASIPGGGAA